MLLTKLKISEIFYSVQGETSRAGFPTVFIRLTGCPLRCQYCDTDYAFSGGQLMTIEEILTETKKYNTHYITVTGGEPLAQKNVHLLMQVLCDLGYDVSIETGGSIDIEGLDSRVRCILDIKTPDSEEASKNFWANLSKLKPQDEIKFVICSHNDYEWSKQIIVDYNLIESQIIFSPSYSQVNASDLAQWILKDQLKLRMQIQLHKLLSLK